MAEPYKQPSEAVANGPLYYDAGPMEPGVPEGVIWTPNVGPVRLKPSTFNGFD